MKLTWRNDSVYGYKVAKWCPSNPIEWSVLEWGEHIVLTVFRNVHGSWEFIVTEKSYHPIDGKHAKCVHEDRTHRPNQKVAKEIATEWLEDKIGWAKWRTEYTITKKTVYEVNHPGYTDPKQFLSQERAEQFVEYDFEQTVKRYEENKRERDERRV